jgi:hypothetical protein
MASEAHASSASDVPSVRMVAGSFIAKAWLLGTGDGMGWKATLTITPARDAQARK